MTRLLINLPPSFFATPASRRILDRATGLCGEARLATWNTPDEIRADLAWASHLLYWSWPVLDDALLASAPGLQWSGQLDCSRRGAEACLRRGLPVSLAKWCWSPAVSEMALALVLGLLRRTSAYHAGMRAGTETWVGDFPGSIDARERELTGRRVGIIGFGRIGRRLRELLLPFRCEVRVFDPYLPASAAETAAVRPVPLAELVATCDVIVLCAANAGSALLGPAEFAAMPPEAVFVNVARAALVDHAALAARLLKGDLHAALDVFDHEPLATDSPLRQLPNLHLTPHRAGGLLASVERGLSWLADDLQRHLDGEPLQHRLVETMVPGLDG